MQMRSGRVDVSSTQAPPDRQRHGQADSPQTADLHLISCVDELLPIVYVS